MRYTRIVNAMPLGTTLAADLQAVWDSEPPTVRDAAVGAAQAYYDYASACTFGASVPTNLTTAQRDAMAAALDVLVRYFREDRISDSI